MRGSSTYHHNINTTGTSESAPSFPLARNASDRFGVQEQRPIHDYDYVNTLALQGQFFRHVKSAVHVHITLCLKSYA